MAGNLDGEAHVPNSVGTEAGSCFVSANTVAAPTSGEIRTVGAWIYTTADAATFEGYNFQIIGCRTRTTTASFFNTFTYALQVTAADGLFKVRTVIGNNPIQHYNQTSGGADAPYLPLGRGIYVAAQFNTNGTNTPNDTPVYSGPVLTTLALDGADTPHALSTAARQVSIGGPAGTGSGGSDLAFFPGRIQWAYHHPGALTHAQHLAMAAGVSPLQFLTPTSSDCWMMDSNSGLFVNATGGPSGVLSASGNAAYTANFVQQRVLGVPRSGQTLQGRTGRVFYPGASRVQA